MGTQFRFMKQSNKNMRTSGIIVSLFCLLTLTSGFTRYQTSCSKTDFDGTKTTVTIKVFGDSEPCQSTYAVETVLANGQATARSSFAIVSCNERPRCVA